MANDDPAIWSHDTLMSRAGKLAEIYAASANPMAADVVRELARRYEKLVEIERSRYASAAKVFGTGPSCDLDAEELDRAIKAVLKATGRQDR